MQPLPQPQAFLLPSSLQLAWASVKRAVFFLTSSSVFSELPLGTRLCICVWHHERAICRSAWLETAPAEERKGPFLEQGTCLLFDHRREQTHRANIGRVRLPPEPAQGCFRYRRSQDPDSLSNSFLRFSVAIHEVPLLAFWLLWSFS